MKKASLAYSLRVCLNWFLINTTKYSWKSKESTLALWSHDGKQCCQQCTWGSTKSSDIKPAKLLRSCFLDWEDWSANHNNLNFFQRHTPKWCRHFLLSSTYCCHIRNHFFSNALRGHSQVTSKPKQSTLMQYIWTTLCIYTASVTWHNGIIQAHTPEVSWHIWSKKSSNKTG